MGQSCVSTLSCLEVPADGKSLHHHHHHHRSIHCDESQCLKSPTDGNAKEASSPLARSREMFPSGSALWLDEDGMKTTQPLGSVAASLAPSPRHSLATTVIDGLLSQTSSQYHHHHPVSQSVTETGVTNGGEQPLASPSSTITATSYTRLTKQLSLSHLHSTHTNTTLSHPLATSKDLFEQKEQVVTMTVSRSPNHARNASEGFILKPRLPSRPPVARILLEREEKGNFTSPAQGMDVRKSPFVDAARTLPKTVNTSPHLAASTRGKLLIAAHATTHTHSEVKTSTFSRSSTSANSQISVTSNNPPGVQLNAIDVGFDPSSSPLDLSVANSPMLEPYDCHEVIDDMTVYRAIAAYHREFRDEGLGPSWYTAHQIMKKQNPSSPNQPPPQRVIRITRTARISSMHSMPFSQRGSMVLSACDEFHALLHAPKPQSVLGFLQELNA